MSDDAGDRVVGPGGPTQWVKDLGDVPGGAVAATPDCIGRATAPGGTSFQDSINAITNFAGSHCYFDGWFMSIVSA